MLLTDHLSCFTLTFQGELKVTREEKQMIEQRLQDLEEQHLRQQEQLRHEAEQRALVVIIIRLKYFVKVEKKN